MLVMITLLAGLVLWAQSGQPSADKAPPEPFDPDTRTMCRGWQVLVASSGIGDLDLKDRAGRISVLEEFIPAASVVATGEQGEPEVFRAALDVIESARRSLDAMHERSGRAVVAAHLETLDENLAAVDTACH